MKTMPVSEMMEANMSEWQPIGTAPRDSNILGWNQYDGVLVYRPMYFSSKNFACWDAVYDTENLAEAPTHWMPLPEAPVST